MLQNIINFFVPPLASSTVVNLYHAIVAQARQPMFYDTHGVPDTVDGRFDLLLLHLILVLQRLKGESVIKQELFDLTFADMDRNLREMGVGDMSVGKRMKVMIAAFYGRASTYAAALHRTDDVLAEALSRNLYRGNPVKAKDPMNIAKYMRQTLIALEQQSIEDILAGHIKFPMPTTV